MRRVNPLVWLRYGPGGPGSTSPAGRTSPKRRMGAGTPVKIEVHWKGKIRES